MDLNQLTQIRDRLSQINQAKIESLLKEEVLANGKEIVEIVRDRWKHGLRPDGNIIGSYKDFGYEMFKRQQNPLADGNVDLILDGGLNENLVVNHLRDALFNIFSTDEKAVIIAERYGLSVYGLTDEEAYLVVFEALLRVNKRLFEYARL